MKEPWQKLDSKVVYSNKNFWNIRKDKVINPSGQKTDYQYINQKDFVCIIPLLDNDSATYLVKQYRYPIKNFSWEFSMGNIEEGEDYLQAAKRELEEETGLIAEKWDKIGYSYLANSLTNQGFFIFVCRQLSAGIKKLENSEADMIAEKKSIKEIEEMIKKGEILDSPTIVAFAYLNYFLQNL